MTVKKKVKKRSGPPDSTALCLDRENFADRPIGRISPDRGQKFFAAGDPHVVLAAGGLLALPFFCFSASRNVHCHVVSFIVYFSRSIVGQSNCFSLVVKKAHR